MAAQTKPIKWFGMKLTPEEKEKIKSLAKRRGTSQKEAVMQAVDHEIKKEPLKGEPDSIYEKNKHLFGQTSNGLVDISTNPKYMEGYGQ